MLIFVSIYVVLIKHTLLSSNTKSFPVTGVDRDMPLDDFHRTNTNTSLSSLMVQRKQAKLKRTGSNIPTAAATEPHLLQRAISTAPATQKIAFATRMKMRH